MKKYGALSVCFFLFSCSSKLYIPTESVNSVSVSDLNKGRELYVNHCGSCHSLYLPNQYSAPVWQHNLDEMQARANITDDQKKLIHDYLVNAPK